MMNTSTIKRLVCASAVAAALLLISGAFTAVHGQRDPFAKPAFMRARPLTGPGSAAAKPKVEVNYGPPAIEARIEYFKRLREQAAASGQTLPKVTSVLTLSEMAVTGIFKTPRGYAAMVEATPIKLSYTIYPGEKFFDGQLVAVEENRLVFRKVTKVADKKFVASVENKPLRQFTMKSQVEGTAPSQSSDKPVEVAQKEQPVQPAPTKGVGGAKNQDVKPAHNPFLSPLDEMNKQAAEPQKAPEKTPAKKPAKVARNKGQ